MAPPDRRSGAIIIQDTQSCIPLGQFLAEGDLLYVLTPATTPVEPVSTGHQPRDPFEPFGRALAKHHPWIRHIPYMVRDGITEYHANHLTLAKAVVFVITGPPCAGQPSQVWLSQVARDAAPNIPQIVLTCCSLRDLGPVDGLFPTLLEIPDYSRAQLEAAADLLFASPPLPPSLGGAAGLQPMSADGSSSLVTAGQRVHWPVQEWDMPRDSSAVHEMWCQCLPDRFNVPLPLLQRLLNRPGYSKHFVVRDPNDGSNSSSQSVLGFCATYTTFIDHSDSSWVGCLAVVLVKPGYRRRGIGTSLHSHALGQLVEHRVSRLQLGSTFPRLLYGIPFDMTSENWFRRRGWRIDSTDVAGCGQEACDWLLDFRDWRADGLSSGGLTFRKCAASEFEQVLEFVARESVRKDNVGWYDQYYQLAGSADIQDILLGQEGPVIVATALTYIPKYDTRVAQDLPWAGTLSDKVGGVTCICITDDHLSMAHTRDSVMIRLLNYCVISLKEQGMEKMFLDGIRGGYEGFQSIGFQKWARYKDVWREA